MLAIILAIPLAMLTFGSIFLRMFHLQKYVLVKRKTLKITFVQRPNITKFNNDLSGVLSTPVSRPTF